jgi:PAS domain S-box-containing protein
MTDIAATPLADQVDADFYELVVQSVPEAIIVATPQGEITFANRAAEALFGFRAKEMIGRSITMLAPAQPGQRADAVRWLTRWAGEPLTQQSQFLHLIARRKDGRQMPLDVRVVEAGPAAARRYFITVRDNTDRQRQQVLSKETNLRAARILLVAEDAIVTVDARQNITFFNLAAEAMFGYRVEEVEGRPLTLLLPPAAREHHPEFVTGFGAGASPSRLMSERKEIQGLRRSGEVFPIEATITKVSVGGELTYTAHLRDVTARKAAQARLEESERRFRAMFDHAFGAIALLDPQGTVLEINRSARALTEGGAPLVGTPLWELPWIGGAGPGADDGEARGRLKAAIARAAKGETVRYTARLAEGAGERSIDLSLTPITDESGAVIYILPEGREIAGA